jgi:hypothetical protein
VTTCFGKSRYSADPLSAFVRSDVVCNCNLLQCCVGDPPFLFVMSEVMWIVTNHEENGLDCSSELSFSCSVVTLDVMCVVMFVFGLWLCRSVRSTLFVHPTAQHLQSPPYVSNVLTASHMRPAVSEMVLHQRSATYRNTADRKKVCGSGETRCLSESTPIFGGNNRGNVA